MPFVIDTVQAVFDSDQAIGSVDAPRQGDLIDRPDLKIAGWILGKSTAVERVMIFDGADFLLESPVSLERPDVLAVFDDLPRPANGKPGFEVALYLPDFPDRFDVHVVGVLADGARVELAAVGGHKELPDSETPHHRRPPRAPYHVITLVQQILQADPLAAHDAEFRALGFSITPDYYALNRLRFAAPRIHFDDRPLGEQVQQFPVSAPSLDPGLLAELADLIMPLLQSGAYRDYFNLWAEHGFHVSSSTPEPNTRNFRPTAWVLGAMKSGTTTLHRYLSELAGVCVSDPKEPFFFESEYSLGLDYYRQRYFPHWHVEPIIVDSRHRNLYLPYIPERIFAVNPDARLIVIARSPVDRCYSAWWHVVSAGTEKLTFEAAIDEDLRRIEAGWHMETPHEQAVYRLSFESEIRGLYRTYVDAGYYMDQIERYLCYFSKDQIKIILFEELVREPYAVVSEVAAFIGCEPPLDTQFVPRHENAHRPETGIISRTAMSAEFRAFLREHYREHNARLATFMERDLSHW